MRPYTDRLTWLFRGRTTCHADSPSSLLALVCSCTALSDRGRRVAPAAGRVGRGAAFTPMRLGDSGWRVRVLQSRLHQLDLHSEVVTSRFDEETRSGVATFQRRRSWTRRRRGRRAHLDQIVALTEEPTSEALHNVYTPGRALLERGDRGMRVRQVQARLKQLRWYDARVTGRYAGSTVRGGARASRPSAGSP